MPSKTRTLPRLLLARTVVLPPAAGSGGDEDLFDSPQTNAAQPEEQADAA